MFVPESGAQIVNNLPLVGFALYLAGTGFLIVRSRDAIGIMLVILGWLLILFCILWMPIGGPGDGRPNYFTINNIALAIGVAANVVGIYRMARVAKYRELLRRAGS